MFKKIITLIALLSIINIAKADDEILVEYQVTNFNVNEQIQSILTGINQYSPDKVIITYAGALVYLANNVNVSITENSKVPVVLQAINPMYNYTNGSVSVALMGTTKSHSDDEQSHGNFFEYTTPESGFFSY